MACTAAMFLSPWEPEPAVADLSPLLLQEVMNENKPAEAIIKNFFILMILV
jgi:hypothetical protein